jgi:hypothetical protein
VRNERKEPSLGTLLGLIAVLLFICALAVPLRSDEPISSSVTFNREVIRIFERKCLPCHVPGAVAMSLANYREARLWARGIREELIEQRMPPWRAAPGYGAFANDIGLTPRERTMILTWTDGGAPKGEDRDLPRRATLQREARVPPDHQLQLPPQRIPAGDEHVVRRVTIDPGVAANRLIRPVQMMPGDTRVLRAAFISIEGPRNTPARWIGAWTPWLPRVATPDGAAFRVPDGARLTIELHYRGRDRDVEDRSSLALFFAPDGTPIAGQVVVDGQRSGESTLREETRVWAIFPEMSADAAAGSLEVSARKPDGSIEVLLWIPKRHYEWPTPYILQTPALLPAGTSIKVRTSSPSRVTLGTVESRRATD